jgi:hypothetical protein
MMKIVIQLNGASCLIYYSLVEVLEEVYNGQ